MVSGYQIGDKVGVGTVVDPATVPKSDRLLIKQVVVDVNANGRADEGDQALFVRIPTPDKLPPDALKQIQDKMRPHDRVITGSKALFLVAGVGLLAGVVLSRAAAASWLIPAAASTVAASWVTGMGADISGRARTFMAIQDMVPGMVAPKAP